MDPITQYTDEDIEEYANFLLRCDHEELDPTPPLKLLPSELTLAPVRFKRQTPEPEPGPSGPSDKCPRYPPQDPSGRILTEEGRLWALRQSQLELHERRRRYMVTQEIMGHTPGRASSAMVKLDDICFNFFEILPSMRMITAMKARFLSKRLKQLRRCPLSMADIESQAQDELADVSAILDGGHMILGLWTMLSYCGLGVKEGEKSYDE